MSTYTPDKWVMLKISNANHVSYKVLASWYGGFGGGDSWKLSSGTKGAITHVNHMEFPQHSGSSYVCGRDNYGMSNYAGSILSGWESSVEKGTTIEIMPKDTDFGLINYLDF